MSEDPFPNYSKTKKRDACNAFCYANRYIYLEHDQNTTSIPDSLIVYESLTFPLRNFEKREMSVKSPVEATMNVYLCASDKKHDYYLTYAFRELHYVILSVPRNNDPEAMKNVEFYALVQPAGKIDNELITRPLYLAHSLWGHSLFEEFSNEKCKWR